ncbi:MAG: hypothetical protein QM278_07715 [Pseudomonadota bacterium]|nr:hypothetical protein [Pseudomonadota bacterium]
MGCGKQETFAKLHKARQNVIPAKAGPKSADELTTKIVERFRGVMQKFAYLIFRNMPTEDQDKAEDMIHDIGWKFKTVKQVRDYLELGIFSGNPSRLRNSLPARSARPSPGEASRSRNTRPSAPAATTAGTLCLSGKDDLRNAA